MIVYGAGGQASLSMTAAEFAHRATTPGVFCSAASSSGTPPVEVYVSEDGFNLFQPLPDFHSPIEKYDWNDRRISREFVKLEQKVLANLADADEISLYQTMKDDRNAKVFAERQFRDYEEIRRIKELSKRLSELQKYVRPISSIR